MHNKILHFWFKEIEQKRWWTKDPDFDNLIKRRFEKLYLKAKAGELNSWRKTAHGRLAEIIILDQFPRNMYRDTPQAFESDNLAVMLTQEAISLGCLKNLSEFEKSFLLMPLMHSESLRIQTDSVAMVKKEGLGNLDFAIAHYDIVKKFGRFPHRNSILKRESTHEEIEFLKGPNSSF